MKQVLIRGNRLISYKIVKEIERQRNLCLGWAAVVDNLVSMTTNDNVCYPFMDELDQLFWLSMISDMLSQKKKELNLAIDFWNQGWVMVTTGSNEQHTGSVNYEV